MHRREDAMSDHFHYYEPSHGHGLKHDPLYAIVAPRPIGWISTRSAQGSNQGFNLAPYSFFNLFSHKPPVIGFASIGEKTTVRNIRETGDFCWNLTTRDLAEAMNRSSAAADAEPDKFAFAGVTPVAGRLVGAPRVKESPVAFECALTQIVPLQDRRGGDTGSRLVLGEVIGVHIDTALIRDGVFQTVLAHPVARGGGRGDYFEIGPDTLFEMLRP